jgi:hypothetical protein
VQTKQQTPLTKLKPVVASTLDPGLRNNRWRAVIANSDCLSGVMNQRLIRREVVPDNFLQAPTSAQSSAWKRGIEPAKITKLHVHTTWITKCWSSGIERMNRQLVQECAQFNDLRRALAYPRHVNAKVDIKQKNQFIACPVRIFHTNVAVPSIKP